MDPQGCRDVCRSSVQTPVPKCCLRIKKPDPGEPHAEGTQP